MSSMLTSLTDCASACLCGAGQAVTGRPLRRGACLQGMKTALHRSGAGGSSFDGGSVSTDDKDLVAYWTFDEGQGYLVSDATGHGHDLHATSNPHWQVGVTLPDARASVHSPSSPQTPTAVPRLGCSSV